MAEAHGIPWPAFGSLAPRRSPPSTHGDVPNALMLERIEFDWPALRGRDTRIEVEDGHLPLPTASGSASTSSWTKIAKYPSVRNVSDVPAYYGWAFGPAPPANAPMSRPLGRPGSCGVARDRHRGKSTEGARGKIIPPTSFFSMKERLRITALKSIMTRDRDRPRVLVRLDTDEGITGWGECYITAPTGRWPLARLPLLQSRARTRPGSSGDPEALQQTRSPRVPSTTPPTPASTTRSGTSRPRPGRPVYRLIGGHARQGRGLCRYYTPPTRGRLDHVRP
jgi:hypothetical protein